MIHFLLFTSLILNIIALLCIVILYLRQNKLVMVEKKQEKMMSEMEEVISSYMFEMKEENEKFIKNVKRLNVNQFPDFPLEKDKVFLTSDQSDKKDSQQQRNMTADKVPMRKGNMYQAVQAYKNFNQSEDPKEIKHENYLREDSDKEISMSHDKVENGHLNNPTLIEQILTLQKQGVSIDEIAKRVHKGKTEVELLLRFRREEQE